MAVIVTEGYETEVRSKLGVRSSELPDAEIQQRLITGLAESVIIKRVPAYSSITADIEKLHLENAVISLICAYLCPSMNRRLNTEVKTIDTTWKKGRMDWDALALSLQKEVEESLRQIESVEVGGITISTAPILTVIKGPSTTTATGDETA